MLTCIIFLDGRQNKYNEDKLIHIYLVWFSKQRHVILTAIIKFYFI